MPEPKRPPTLDEAFSMQPPSELEQSLAAQRQPGYVHPNWGNWILDSLPNTDPRKQAIRRAQINHTPLTEEAIRELFK